MGMSNEEYVEILKSQGELTFVDDCAETLRKFNTLLQPQKPDETPIDFNRRLDMARMQVTRLLLRIQDGTLFPYNRTKEIRDIENIQLMYKEIDGDWYELWSMLETFPLLNTDQICMKGVVKDTEEWVTLSKDEEAFYVKKCRDQIAAEEEEKYG